MFSSTVSDQTKSAKKGHGDDVKKNLKPHITWIVRSELSTSTILDMSVMEFMSKIVEFDSFLTMHAAWGFKFNRLVLGVVDSGLSRPLLDALFFTFMQFSEKKTRQMVCWRPELAHPSEILAPPLHVELDLNRKVTFLKKM